MAVFFVAGRAPEVSLAEVLVGCYSVTVSVQAAGSGDNDDKWWLTIVYGPQQDAKKALFLEELETIRDACAGP